MELKFPENFKWGSATSAHQIEGNNHNDWTEWEKSPKRLEDIKARGLKPEDFISGKACDSYTRYEEDFDIAKKLSQNIHRFSIEWSRVEPEEGRFNENEMKHYIDIVKALRDRGIEPMITLWHFTNPVWFAQKGGFLNIDSSKYFVRYVKYVVDNLKDQVGLWITFNEATTVYSGSCYIIGTWPPQHRNIFEWRRANKNVIRCHVEAYKEIKKIYGQSPISSFNEVRPLLRFEVEPRNPNSMSHNVEVGFAESNQYIVMSRNPFKKLIGKIYKNFRNFYFHSKAFPYYDFIGVNYYRIDRRFFKNYDILPEQELMLEKGWELYPEGLFHNLKEMNKYKKPIFVTENGTASVDDSNRAKFIKNHIYWVHKAVQGGVNIRGYLYWSLLDNFEIDHGFPVRFGLIEMDYKTFERHTRPSAWEYAKICKTNQLEIDS